MSHPSALKGPNRRQIMLAGAAATASVGLGCRSSDQPTTETVTTPSSDVPLRVLLCGSETDVDAIRLGWGAVDEQPIDITLIAMDRSSTDGLLTSIVQAAKENDVLIIPVMSIAELDWRGALTQLSDEEVELAEQQGGPFLTSLRNGPARFAGRFVAVPLGAHQPALIAPELVDSVTTWSEYHDWVESLEGAAAEPLADGWAGAMFLWRASSTISSGWLFSREDLEPVIDRPSYQDVLSQMRETARLYSVGRIDPTQIWSELQSGKLKGGLGFAVGQPAEDAALTFSDAPSEVLPRVCVEPFSPVACLSSESRQTAVSKKFMRWLSGGEGSGNVRREATGMTVTRSGGNLESDSQSLGRPYDQWLRKRLRVPNTMPTLQLRAADEYYTLLDRQVARCLDGEVEPAEALTEVKQAWGRLHTRVGLRKQERSWRQAQGMTT